jgi:NADPH-dependent 2,4-dienoyl-CoA reductase/sulfur reductase-like enzyme/rhodanese-related sulfurtransferase
MSKRIVIIGGVAAGASAATKARRTSEDVQIALIEAGPYVSFANCGLPYYVGGEIADRDNLFVVSPEMLARRFRIDVRLNTTATAIDRKRKTVALRPADGTSEELAYDRLILATGAVPFRPPIKGLDHPNVLEARTIPDADAITALLARLAPTGTSGQPAEGGSSASAGPRALVIGGGYIGLEMAEQLLRRGLTVSVVEMAGQLMPAALDAEMAVPLAESLHAAGCPVILGEAVTEITERNGQTVAVTASGRELLFDLGICALGVRPNVELAKAAGLSLGATGAIRVDSLQRTSDASIYAAGDNSETIHLVLGRPVNIALAGSANKAGRVAGANAAMDLAGATQDDPRRLRLRGVLGTAIVRAGRSVAGVTGLTETQARREGLAFKVTYMSGSSHAGYYPGAERLLVKVLYNPATGRLLGAQVTGGDGVDKRIDVLATAIVGELGVEDLEQLDLCYAPPFGSAKDVVVVAGFAAANQRRGTMPAITPGELLDLLEGAVGERPVVLDVRTQREWDAGHLEGAIHVPVDDLRDRLSEVPKGRPIAVHCAGGYRSYLAQQILMHNRWSNVRNVLGGFSLIQQVRKTRGEATSQ